MSMRDEDMGGPDELDGEIDLADEFGSVDDDKSPLPFLLILAVGGFGLGILVFGITYPTATIFNEYVGEMGWVLVPTPLLLFGLGAIWQIEWEWLRRLGAASIGLALSQYLVFAISNAVLDI